MLLPVTRMLFISLIRTANGRIDKNQACCAECVQEAQVKSQTETTKFNTNLCF